MATKTNFQGKFIYYENINGKEKKISKSFTDPKKMDAFTKKYPMPTLKNIFGLTSSMKKKSALTEKKSCKSSSKKSHKK